MDFQLKLTSYGKNKNFALRVIWHKHDLDFQSVSKSLDARVLHKITKSVSFSVFKMEESFLKIRKIQSNFIYIHSGFTL